MANWSQTHSQGWGDFSAGWEATINGTKFSIVVDERTGRGTLYRSAPGRASTKVKDGSVNELKRYAETLRASRLGQPERFARRDDLYRLLSRPVTISNKAEMGRLAAEAMKQPDFTPAGQDMSLHDLASDVGIEIEALRSRASRPGVKDTMAQPKFKVGDKVRNTHGDVIGVVADMWMDNNSEPVYRLVDESKQGIGQFKERHLLRASRPGEKDTMAVEDRFYFGKGRKERFA